jgi:membrane protease YdiL (CAAX protease family)
MQSKTSSLKEAATFFALTLGLSYFIFWGPLALFKVTAISFVSKAVGPIWAVALFIIGGFVPSLVAIALTVFREGMPGLRRLGRRVIQFNIGWRWYLAVIAVVAIATAGQILINRLLAYTFDLSLFLAQLGSLLPLIVLGPLSEELGWRGYALDRLQTRFNALVCSLLLGAAWALWHLPLFYMIGTSQHELGVPFLGFAAGLIAVSVIFTWLANNTGSSIWAAIFFHWIYTYSGQVIATGVTRTPLFNWLEYLPYIFFALVIVAIWGPRTLRRGAQTGKSLESQYKPNLPA